MGVFRCMAPVAERAVTNWCQTLGVVALRKVRCVRDYLFNTRRNSRTIRAGSAPVPVSESLEKALGWQEPAE